MRTVIGVLLALTVWPLHPENVIPLWDDDGPYSKPNSLEEYIAESWGVPYAENVTRPTLTVHPAQGESSRRAVVILPGGGYERESILAEGRLIAEYLSAQGITTAVLKYRLPLPEASDRPYLLPITDARRAIGLTRSFADTYGFDPTKVGVLGFSAGGHLATTISVRNSPTPGESPDFPRARLCRHHFGFREPAMAGANPLSPADDRRGAPTELPGRPCPSSTPPAFLVHAYDNEVVPISESQAYAAAMTAAGRTVETHFFARGGHGFGPGRAEDRTAQWLGLVADWIKRQ